MKTEYKWIHFVKVEQKSKTSVWSCRNNNTSDELGQVKWYPAWRRYCYFPLNDNVYEKGCLGDIIHFLNQLKEEP